MVAPKTPIQPQNMPTQNSISVNDEEEPVDTIANIEIPVQKLRDFPIEFDFSNHRKSVRTEYLKSIGFDESQIKKMFQKASNNYMREEGIDEGKIEGGIKKRYDIYIDFEQMIMDFKKEEKLDMSSEKVIEEDTTTSFEKYEINEKKLKKSQLKKKKQQIRRVNQKS